MGSEVSTIQSLKAVDAWIDVINANINGGVRTAFKASRLHFSGSNTDVQRTGNTTSLPLQFPEPSLTTMNTIIDFTQGAITASTENTHLAIQGEGFFVLADPRMLNADGTFATPTANSKLYLTRDGEFHTNQNGVLVNNQGYVLVCPSYWNYAAQQFYNNSSGSNFRAVYNNLDTNQAATVATFAVRLSDYVKGQIIPTGTILADGVTADWSSHGTTLLVDNGKQSLRYSQLGSTVYDIGFDPITGGINPNLHTNWALNSPILTKSLESSNSSMTQSVPELSLAQKLFSALTKVLQTKQTNVDGVLNLVR